MTTETSIEKQFECRCIDVANKTAAVLSRDVPYFRQMLASRGAVGAATHLVHRHQPSSTFEALRRANRLDLTMESVILEPEWASLFTDADKAVARARLRHHGMVEPLG